MSKTIELIDKYRIEQGCERDYNPPTYVWDDNTGEIVRCEDCKYYDKLHYYTPQCENDCLDDPSPDEYCSRGERA